MKDKLLKIIEHYGVMNQLKYFQSEVFELNEAIIRDEEDCDWGMGNKELVEFNKNNIEEEIADVLVMLKQFQLYYGIDSEQIKKIMNEKIDRQLDRMEKEI